LLCQIGRTVTFSRTSVISETTVPFTLKKPCKSLKKISYLSKKSAVLEKTIKKNCDIVFKE